MKKQLSICCIDWCEFTFIAPILSNFFEKVYYNPNPTKSGFTEIAAAKLGSGLKDVEQIPTIWRKEDEIDIFLFPDIEFSDLAYKLKKDGHNVWGSGDAELLELDRVLFLDELKAVGLPIPETEVIETLEKELEYVKDKKDIWIKINKYRGIRETFHFEDWDNSDIIFDDIKTKVRPFAKDKDLVFLNQKPIKSKAEYGRDRYAIKGEFAKNFFLGFEKKGLAYVSKFVNRKELFKESNDIDDRFSKILQKYDYTGFVSDEIRIADSGEHYLIDPALRCGYPSSPSYFHAVTNWGDIISEGVKGNLIEPESRYKYCAELIIHYDYDGYSPINFKDIKDGVFMPTTHAIRDDKVWRVPPSQLYADSKKAGICVGGGQTLEEAIENCMKIYDLVDGDGLDKQNPLQDLVKVTDDFSKITGYKY